MTEYRIHYGARYDTSRCGIISPRNWTFIPANVTCKTCLKLLKGKVK